mmetsp:Transcript_10004/g.11949  ORF Transcript_10004/g.11949 Transcript_10004/m.11949 type:complete len:431 (-) Transcript_10004:147-1439(-)
MDDTKHFDEARTIVDDEEDRAEADVLFQKGYDHLFGTNFKEMNIKMAAKMIVRAANLGHLCAKGECLMQGWTYRREQNYMRAFSYFTKALHDDKSDVARYALAICRMYGFGCQMNWSVGISLLATAIDQGNECALNSMGCFYERGEGVPKNRQRAKECYEAAAKRGNSAAMYNLAVWYDRRGTDEDLRRALDLYSRAASQKNKKAMYALSLCFRHDDDDLPRIVRWAKRAAADGNMHAQYHLGTLYSIGFGVVSDYSHAAELWEDAAEQGHALAQMQTARCYEQGRGRAKNEEKAYYWYRLCAENGGTNHVGMGGERAEVAWRCAIGKGVKRNIPEGILFFIGREPEEISLFVLSELGIWIITAILCKLSGASVAASLLTLLLLHCVGLLIRITLLPKFFTNVLTWLRDGEPLDIFCRPLESFFDIFEIN